MDDNAKIEKFSTICETVKRITNKVRKHTLLRFYKALAVLTGLFRIETWT